MSVTVKCHSDAFLTFPKECVRCGKAPKKIFTIDAARRVDIVVAAHETYTEITVPMCRWCAWQRRFWGFTIGLTIVVSSIGGAMILVHGAPKATRLWYVAGLLVTFAVAVIYIRNWHSSVMNRILTGCSAGRLQTDGTFSLWLRRDEIADQLSYQSQPRRYIDTVGYATETERAQQQIAAWWGKCVFGGIMLLVSASLWYDITQFEAGQKRFLNLPSLLMMLYDFLGKWAAVLPIGIPGLALFGFGVRQFIKEKITGE